MYPGRSGRDKKAGGGVVDVLGGKGSGRNMREKLWSYESEKRVDD